MGPTGRSRILQIHPTRLCNLRCRHCYSSSGPEEKGGLEPHLLRSVLDDAQTEGYTVTGFSGGEPLLYKPLPEILEHAGTLGFFRTVTSNGMLLDERRLELLAGRVELLAISLDGIPESHNQVRGHERAFETMVRRLEGVRASGIPFGFIFTLTQYNLDELPWVADFAARQRAALLQIHPLEIAGRAEEQLPDARPDDQESAWALVACKALERKYHGQMKVQLDLLDREGARQYPEKIYADESEDRERRPLGDMLSPLILEPDGVLVPIRFGFPRHYAIGDVHHEGLCSGADHWRREKAPDFFALCRRLYEDLAEETGLPMVNWYERLHRLAASEARESARWRSAPSSRGLREPSNGKALVQIQS